MGKYIVGISGASGVILGLKTAEAIASMDHEVFLLLSDAAKETSKYELQRLLMEDQDVLNWFSKQYRSNIIIFDNYDFASCINSGTYHVDGMVVVPCKPQYRTIFL